jgi:transposase
MSCRSIKKLKEVDAQDLFDSSHLVLTAQSNISTIRFLSEKVNIIEKEVKSQAALSKQYQYLLSVPGIGNILALTIMLEVGDISRFVAVGKYGSYCRCVRSQRLSDNKKKGEGNRKNGNKYLAWAYVEAAHFAIRTCPKAQRFYQRKKAKANGALATKALSNKLARASYYVMRDQVPYDGDKLFG